MKKIKILIIVLILVIVGLIYFNRGKIFSGSVLNGNQSIVDSKEKYHVVKVLDGDTMEIRIGSRIEKVRLIGIDTPETSDPRKVVQCYGNEAKQKALALLQNKDIYLETDPAVGERDKYNRLLAYIFLDNNINFNKLMISEGYAHEYTYQSQFYKYQQEFRSSQEDARINQRGFWSDLTCSGNTKQPAK